jgi:membrane protease YdiL (CAAX protease family)
LRFDATFLALRFVPSLAVGVVMVAIYLRTRNLLSLALAHWLIDALTGALTLLPPK